MLPEPSRPSEIAKLTLQRLLPHFGLLDAFRRVCEVSAKTLNVERVSVWLYIDNDTVLRCANLYELSTREHSSGTLLRVSAFPRYFKSLTIRKAVPAEVATTDSWTQELAASYLQPLKIGSMLDAGIFVDGKMVGVLCHEHVGHSREWPSESRDFVGSLADLLALKIQAAEMNELRKAFKTQHERLVAHARTEAISEVAAGVAHDFSNLLTVFLGHSTLLLDRSDLPKDVHELAKQFILAAEQGTALSNQLMQLTISNEKPPVVIDFGKLVAETLLIKSTLGAKHQLRTSGDTELGQVLLDKSHFSRLLLNLVLNARDAMANGGVIDIQLPLVRIPDTEAEPGRFVLLEVRDSGVGIDEQQIKKIFDPFYTNKKNGTGLGLAIVKHAIDRIGGFIQVESKPNEGTSFRVFFPRIGTPTGGTAELPALRPIPTKLIV